MDRSPEGFTTPRRERRVGYRSRHAPGGTLRRPIFPTGEKRKEGKKGRKKGKRSPIWAQSGAVGEQGEGGENPDSLHTQSQNQGPRS